MIHNFTINRDLRSPGPAAPHAAHPAGVLLTASALRSSRAGAEPFNTENLQPATKCDRRSIGPQPPASGGPVPLGTRKLELARKAYRWRWPCSNSRTSLPARLFYPSRRQREEQRAPTKLLASARDGGGSPAHGAGFLNLGTLALTTPEHFPMRNKTATSGRPGQPLPLGWRRYSAKPVAASPSG